MKHLLVIFIILGVLMFPIPYDKAKSLSKEEFTVALDHMLGFFKTVTKCKKAGYVDMYQEGNNLIFVIECQDDKEA